MFRSSLFALAVATASIACPIAASADGMVQETDKVSPHAPAISQTIVREAVRDGRVSPEMALAVARADAHFGPAPVSRFRTAGACDLSDPEIAARLDVRRLGGLFQRYGYRRDDALSHYYRGRLSRDGWRAPRGHVARYVDQVQRWEAGYRRDAAVQNLIAHARAEQDADRLVGGGDGADAANKADPCAAPRTAQPPRFVSTPDGGDGYWAVTGDGERWSERHARNIANIRREFRQSLAQMEWARSR